MDMCEESLAVNGEVPRARLADCAGIRFDLLPPEVDAGHSRLSEMDPARRKQRAELDGDIMERDGTGGHLVQHRCEQIVPPASVRIARGPVCHSGWSRSLISSIIRSR